MADQPQWTPGPPNLSATDSAGSASSQLRLIAPVWHTMVMVALILGNSYLGARGLPANISSSGRLLLYGMTFVTQLVLFLFIWFGLRLKQFTMRELIGGRWKTPEGFLIDIGIAAGFWIVSTILRLILMVALHMIDLRHPEVQADAMKRAIAPVVPHTGRELAFFLPLVAFAGFFEEIIFRGYLQRQFAALTRNIWLGVIVASIFFGAAHGYQGTRLMVLIAMYGAMFGVLAVMVKNLRPGMIAHAGQDSIAGLLSFILERKGLF